MDAMKGRKGIKANRAAKDVINQIISKDTNQLFRSYMDMEGSVRCGIKVGKPDEFDFSWALNIKKYSLSRKGVALSNESCRNHKHLTESACMKSGNKWENSSVRIPKEEVFMSCIHVEKHCDKQRFSDLLEGDCLPPRAVSKYVHELVSEVNIGEYDLRLSKHVYGPAIRLSIDGDEMDHKISIDITSRLDVPFNKLPVATKDAVYEVVSKLPRAMRKAVDLTKTVIYLIPKSEESWKFSFANYENAIIDTFDENSGDYRKKVLRKAKLTLRKWKRRSLMELDNVSSYLLKTIFLEMCKDMPSRNEWTDNLVDLRYVDMFKRLRDYAQDGTLFEFFNPTVNLLDTVSDDACEQLITYISEEIGEDSTSEEENSSSDEDSQTSWLRQAYSSISL